jgi:hypothetical protein
MKKMISEPMQKWRKVRIWIPKELKKRPDYKVYRRYEGGTGGGHITLVMDRMQKLVQQKPNTVIRDFDASCMKNSDWELSNFCFELSLYEKLISMVDNKSIDTNNKKLQAVVQYLLTNNYFNSNE